MDKIFPNNEAIAERIGRVVIGLGVVSMAFVGPKTPFAYLGLILVVTGALGSCPIYTLFGLSTNKSKETDQT